MAIYHFSAQIISRSQGRSSVAASAYRAGESLHDERTNRQHDFSKKADIIKSEIFLPEKAPKWMTEREKLWNAVEGSEKRKDAQLAREINIALPRELNYEQNWQLAKSFVEQEFVSQGMVADLSLHSGHKASEEQPHVHVMLSLREVSEEGFGMKVRAWNSKNNLNAWREHWAEHCNKELAKQDLDIRIDHRTLEAQGINLEPQSKIGAKAASIKLARYVEHEKIAYRNGERLVKEPEVVIDSLTKQQSSFTMHDVARFINRHSQTEEQFSAIYEKVKVQPELVALGLDQAGQQRFTSQEMLGLESKMLKQAEQKATENTHSVANISIEQALATRSLSTEQTNSLQHLVRGGDVTCLVGFAGTGKSYMLGAAREAWQAEGYRVRGMTLSGIAAENLEAGAGIESHTIASRLWRWDRGQERLGGKDIIVVDEAGMLGSRQMAKILDEAERAKAKVVLVGDPEQLQAIEAGAAFRAIAERVGFAEMSEIRRQREVWQQQATKDFAQQRTVEGIKAYEQHDNVHRFETKAEALLSMVDSWDETRNQSENKSQIMLAYTRAEVAELNEQARTLLRRQGELGTEHKLETSRGEKPFAENDRIYFLRNENRKLQVKNGTLGTIKKICENEVTVRLDGVDGKPGREVGFNLQEYNDIDYGYAATVYKAQGVTVDRAHILGSRYFDRHSSYVAMSRHREGADLYYSRDEFPSFTGLCKALGREQTKDVSLDYAKDRGIEVNESTLKVDRYINLSSNYSEVLTEERAARAEQRLEARQKELILQEDTKALIKQTGFALSNELEVGEKGTYRGLLKVEDRHYGFLEQGDRQGKIIPYENLTSKVKDQTMIIAMGKNEKGVEMCFGKQPQIKQRQKELTLGRGLEL